MAAKSVGADYTGMREDSAWMGLLVGHSSRTVLLLQHFANISPTLPPHSGNSRQVHWFLRVSSGLGETALPV